ncbi:MAG: sigma-70 family RNA polymerase sigma factor, partial [Clostridia bacterium]|nr:sigma-70 family RNA polymerase sigma factor [Clostridia bacterium]
DIIRRNRLFLPLPQQQETNILSDIMCDALSHLSAAERAIVYERAVMDTSYAELAKRLGLREDNVRKKYERAKKKLAKLLSHTKKGDFS